jgi:hypothetical protein
MDGYGFSDDPTTVNETDATSRPFKSELFRRISYIPEYLGAANVRVVRLFPKRYWQERALMSFLISSP